MLGGWWFGCSPSSPDSNFLRVGNVFPNRRLSDNTLMTPKIRIAPSCASSPGGTPGSGLPTRRHSSIGPQERRGSTINLSPPTVSCLCLARHWVSISIWTLTIFIFSYFFLLYLFSFFRFCLAFILWPPVFVVVSPCAPSTIYYIYTRFIFRDVPLDWHSVATKGLPLFDFY